MWKWIGGGCLVIILCVCAVVYYGYRKIKSVADGGPNSTIVIQAPAARVFASLANADSLAQWRATGAKVTPPHNGMLAIGDTVSSPQRARTGNGNTPAAWVVSALARDSLIAYQIVDQRGAVMMTQRDSLVSLGDSTRVVVSFTTPILDSARARQTGATGTAGMGIATTMITAAMRIESDQELKNLKTQIESAAGTPATVPPATPPPATPANTKKKP